MSSKTLLLLALAACSLRPSDFGASATDGDASTTTAPDPTTGPPPLTTGPPATTTSTATTDPPGSSGSTAIENRDGGTILDCDQWTEDCPEGQKCAPFSDSGGSWDRTRCVPIVPDPDGFGEPCMVLGSGLDGGDTCDKHLMCWDVDGDTGVGVCIGKCLGTPEMHHCEDPAANCLVSDASVLILCIKGCDPLLQNCLKDTDVCVSNPMDPDRFICVIDASGDEGQAFDPCEYGNACDAGLLCANVELAAECDPMAAPGCCLPFCDTSVMPAPCPGAGQQCIPWYEPGQAPPGLETVGYCGLPL